jgi:hypothetical protein
MHQAERNGRVKDVILHSNGYHRVWRNAQTNGAVTNAEYKPREPRVVDDAEGSSRRAHGRRRRIVPRLK